MSQISIDFLKNHIQAIPRLVALWEEGIGKKWTPDYCIGRVRESLHSHLNDHTLPLTLVALYQGEPIGMCSLRENDGLEGPRTPWLGSLVVDPKYQKQGVGKLLIDAVKEKAQALGFQCLYLFAFDPTIPDYYERLGWKKLEISTFKGHSVTVMEIEMKDHQLN